MPAPTFVAEHESVWFSAGAVSSRSVAVTAAAGDTLVAFAQVENNPAGLTLSISGGTGVTWTQQVASLQGSGGTHTLLYIWTAHNVPAQAAATVTVTMSAQALSGLGLSVLRFSGSAGIGAVTTTGVVGAGTEPSVPLTTTAANSAVVLAGGDWNASDGAARVARTGAGAFTGTTYDRSTSFTVAGGYHADAGAAGAKTLGYTGWTPKWNFGAVEVLGTVTAVGARRRPGKRRY